MPTNLFQGFYCDDFNQDLPITVWEMKAAAEITPYPGLADVNVTD